MRKIVFAIICLQSTFVFSQLTGTFYYCALGNFCDEKDAKTMYIISSPQKDTYEELSYTKYNNGWNPNGYNTYHFESDSSITIKSFINKKLTKEIKRIYKKQNDSIFSFIDYKNNSLITTEGFATNILPLTYHGKIVNYYDNGNKRYEAIYDNNRLISNVRWKENGKEDISNVFDFGKVEIDPQFIDGSFEEYIRKEIRYPVEALENNIKGQVILQFIVMENGSINGIKILKSVDPSLDNEAIRIIKQTNKKWLPGRINNVPIRVACNIPFAFNM